MRSASIADFTPRLLEFLDSSPTPFHAVASLVRRLDDSGFTRLEDAQSWDLRPGKGYYLVRNGSAIVAFKLGTQALLESGIRVAGAHTDSPCLKLKPAPVLRRKNYLQLGVEVYGGALLNPWFDRDLSLAGRIDFVAGSGALDSALIDVRKPIATIPSLAIHLDRTANEGRKINPQTEMAPIVLQAGAEEEFSFDAYLQQQLAADGIEAQQILAHELMLYDTQPASLVGMRDEFLASARLDNLLSCFLACEALIAAPNEHTSLVVCNDHEEVGSVSSSGAQGPLLKSVAQRILSSQSGEPDAFARLMSRSSLLSIDNAHGVHPNFVDRHDEGHGPLLNAGPVIKINANQRYASNSHGVALFKSLCARVGVEAQTFVMRADMACGSTIGPLTSAALGIETVDVGVPTFGMHSIRELAGRDDAQSMAKVVTAFFAR